MRWLYYNRSSHAEASQHDQVLRRIDLWWQEFARSTDRLDALFRQTQQWDLADWMQRHLQAIHPDLMWEFGPAVNGRGHRLVITPETHSELRPLAAEVVARAPRMAGWEFYNYRLAETAQNTLPMVQARTGVDISNVTAAVSAGEHHRIDLVFRWDRLPTSEDDAFDAAFVTTESVLGELAMDRWVGVIRVVDSSTEVEHGQRFLSLDRLKPTFDAVQESLISQLPSEPYAALVEDGQWAVLKLQPTDAADYPERYDLLTCVTCNSDLVAATFSEAPFFSERYSRCGETFCYLKIDGSDLSGMDYQDREDMEEAIRNAVEGQELGCLIGSGTGLRYTYAELALTDVDRAITAIRQVLREGNVPRRSWLLFHDADLSAEWIGMHEDTPPPPE
ncbi:MAG: hypothetical protein R3C49_06495 [Planctomycetaceae bacterium]